MSYFKKKKIINFLVKKFKMCEDFYWKWPLTIYELFKWMPKPSLRVRKKHDNMFQVDRFGFKFTK